MYALNAKSTLHLVKSLQKIIFYPKFLRHFILVKIIHSLVICGANEKDEIMKMTNYIVFFLMAAVTNLYAGFSETAQFTPFSKQLSLRAIENQTINSAFKVYYSNGDSLALLTPQSTFLFKPQELFLQQHELLCLKCVKGSFLPIYIKHTGKAAGQAPTDFHGPYYIAMWLNYPDVPEEQKQYVRYCVKDGQQAEFSIRINPKGDCQIIALSNMVLLP